MALLPIKLTVAHMTEYSRQQAGARAPGGKGRAHEDPLVSAKDGHDLGQENCRSFSLTVSVLVLTVSVLAQFYSEIHRVELFLAPPSTIQASGCAE